MKVCFKLNDEQFASAIAMVHQAEEHKGSLSTEFYSGNIMGWLPRRPGMEPRATLNLVRRAMIFEGDRDQMHQLGMLGAMKDVLGSKWREARWFFYDSEDRRLRWDDSIDRYMRERAHWRDWVNHHVQNGIDITLNIIPARFVWQRAMIEAMTKKSRQALLAEYDIKDVRLMEQTLAGKQVLFHLAYSY